MGAKLAGPGPLRGLARVPVRTEGTTVGEPKAPTNSAIRMYGGTLARDAQCRGPEPRRVVPDPWEAEPRRGRNRSTLPHPDMACPMP
jgi:hypothetical protein